MTEISFPTEGSPISPSRGPSRRIVIIAVIVIHIVVGGIIGFVILGGGSDHISSLLWTRSGIDADVYPPDFYYGEFELVTDHVNDETPPDILFTLSYDTGSDTGYVYTYVAVYELDIATFDGMDWLERDLYLVDYDEGYGDFSTYIDLPQVTGDYTWVLFIVYEELVKSDVWSCDFNVYLRYNWIVTD